MERSRPNIYIQENESSIVISRYERNGLKEADQCYLGDRLVVFKNNTEGAVEQHCRAGLLIWMHSDKLYSKSTRLCLNIDSAKEEKMMYRLELASDAFPLFNYSPETVFFSQLQLIARSERTQQKFIYSLLCDFPAAEQGSWPQERGYWRLLKHMWSWFLLICPVSGLATKSRVQDASVWEEKWVVFKNPAEAPPKVQLTGTKMELGHKMLARVWRPVQLRSRMFTLFCCW